MTTPLGMTPTDLILRTGIILGLRNLRANPWKLRACFNRYLQDDLTSASYGREQVDAAIKFIQKHDFPVYQSNRIDDPRPPCIVINLVESVETDPTLGEGHYDFEQSAPTGLFQDEWPALCPPFSPVAWDHAGADGPELTLPAATTELEIVYPGMYVLDRTGQAYEIQDTRTDSEGLTVLTLPEGTRGDFEGAVIKSRSRTQVMTLGSVWNRETYMLGVHTTEASHMVYLHDCLRFLLWHFRKTLFEARGLEVSSISSSDWHKNSALSMPDTHERFVTVSGKVRHVWPLELKSPVEAVVPRFASIDGENLPPDLDPDLELWIGDDD